MAFLKTNCKKVYCSDGTFAGMIDYYSCFVNLCNRSLREVNIIDKNAFENCDLLLFPSDWAANSAINGYNINSSKVKTIPFGANIEEKYSDVEIKNIIKNRRTDRCNLLFIGVDWERKGGNIALEIAKELHSQDINVYLDIVGIKKMPVSLPDYITNHGFISKKTVEGKNKLIKLFEDAHFLVLPTRQECFGIVFAEASSFGVPSITTKTGGVETAVKDNINGMTFALSEPAKKYADYIKKLFTNHEEYEKLCLSAFNDYKTRLNWDVAGKEMTKAIIEIINNSK
jgi:glycosyltransferase involved in cell wall biosynthesis